MLKVLLYAFASILALASYAQDIPDEWSAPSEVVVEDPNRIISDLNAVNSDAGKLQLNWRVSSGTPSFIAIERSGNGKNFEVVGVLNRVNSQRHFQWIDDAPKTGRNFYRLRYSFQEGDSLYSQTVSALVTGDITYKFYPNPVDHVLIIRSESAIDVQISDATGKVRLTHPRIQGISTINVSSLEKGVYLIRFTNKLTNVMSQEKLIKN